MKLQKIFFIFLILSGSGASGYFSVRTARALFTYFTCKENAAARITRWEIKEIRGKFFLKAFYSFESSGTVWQGATHLTEPWFLNEASAIIALREKAKQKWMLWFNPKDPTKSSLERSFPTGLIARTLVCYGVLVYFVVFLRKIQKNI